MIVIKDISINMWNTVSALTNGCKKIIDIKSDDYLIAEITCNTGGLFLKKYYGYISKKDYNDFLLGALVGTLSVLHPYENGKSIVININSILSINI